VKDLKIIKDLFIKNDLPVKDAGAHQLKAKFDDVPIDILFADSYIGADVVHRAVEKKLGEHFVRVATPEDLIILKTMANRSVDRRDIEELRELFGKSLDENYIKKKLSHLKKTIRKLSKPYSSFLSSSSSSS